MFCRTANKYPPITFAIGAQETSDVSVSVCPSYTVSGKGNKPSARDMWLNVKEVSLLAMFENLLWREKNNSVMSLLLFSLKDIYIVGNMLMVRAYR